MTSGGWAARRGSGLALVLVLSAAGTQAQTPPVESQATDAALQAMSHRHDAGKDPHLLLSARRGATAADSARATELLATIRRELSRYREVDSARKDGYEPFLPHIPLPIYHFVNRFLGLLEAVSFDPARPTALLYRKNADGSFVLSGVMYTAPHFVDETVLDQRIPLSLVRWHQHVNWCMPRRGEQHRWADSVAGKPRFGPESPIATRESCLEAGGRFRPKLFGWMVHVNAFGSDDPREIWGDHH